MSTHVHVFSLNDHIPTLSELFDIAQQQGHPLKLSLDMFDDDEEEQEFLDEYLDSVEWRDVSLSNPADQWVLKISYIRRNETFFTESIQNFSKLLDKVEASPAKQQVAKHLNATRVYFDIQISVAVPKTLPPQEAIIGYFQAQDTNMLFMENVGVYVQGQETILKV